MPGIWSGRSGGMKRVKMVRSGWRPARVATTGRPLSIRGAGHGRRPKNPLHVHAKMDASLGQRKGSSASPMDGRSQCFSQSHRRTVQASTPTVSHAAVARTRAKAGDRSISSQITAEWKQQPPQPPSGSPPGPTASTAAATPPAAATAGARPDHPISGPGRHFR